MIRRFMRSIMSGDKPHLITCAPSAITTWHFFRYARTIASITFRKFAEARISGRDSKKAYIPSAGKTGLANRLIFERFFRSFIEYVLILQRSSGFKRSISSSRCLVIPAFSLKDILMAQELPQRDIPSHNFHNPYRSLR